MTLLPSITRGATSQIVPVRFQDLSLLNGAGKTGLTTASFTSVYYYRGLAATAVAITLDGTMTPGTWKTSGFVEVDATHQPGEYQLGLPNLAVGTADASPYLTVVFITTAASGANQVELVIPLQVFDLQTATQSVNVTQWLGQAVHAAVNGYPQVDLTYILGTLLTETAGQLAAGFKQFFNVASPTGTQNDSTTLLARLGAFTGTGVNTVLGFLRAMSRSDLAAPSDMGGTYDPAADSLQAIITALGTISINPAAIWDYLTTLIVTPGSIGVYILAKLGLITSGNVTISNPVNPASLALTLYSNVDYLPTSGAALPTWTSADWTVYGLQTATSVILYYADTNSTVDTALGTMVVDSATSIHLTATAAQVFAVPLGENVVGYKIIAVLDVAHGGVEVQLANASLSHLNYNLYSDQSNPNTTP